MQYKMNSILHILLSILLYAKLILCSKVLTAFGKLFFLNPSIYFLLYHRLSPFFSCLYHLRILILPQIYLLIWNDSYHPLNYPIVHFDQHTWFYTLQMQYIFGCLFSSDFVLYNFCKKSKENKWISIVTYCQFYQLKNRMIIYRNLLNIYELKNKLTA